MKKVDPVKYGQRVRERRETRGLSQEALGKRSGYSQSNIGWIEKGTMKRPQASAAQLSEALLTPAKYLLWGTGPKDAGPTILTGEEAKENYEVLSLEDQADISSLIVQRVAAAKEKLKRG